MDDEEEAVLRRPYRRTLDESTVRPLATLRLSVADATHRLDALLAARSAVSEASSLPPPCYAPASLRQQALAECRALSSQLRAVRQELQHHGSSTSGGDCSGAEGADIERDVALVSLMNALLLNDSDQQLAPSLAACARWRRAFVKSPQRSDADLDAEALFYSLELLCTTFEGCDDSGNGAQLESQADVRLAAASAPEGSSGEARRELIVTAFDLAACGGCVADFPFLLRGLAALRSCNAWPPLSSLAAKFPLAIRALGRGVCSLCVDLVVMHLTHAWCAKGGDTASGASSFKPVCTAARQERLEALATAEPVCSRAAFEEGRCVVDPSVLPQLPPPLLAPICAIVGFGASAK